MTLFSASFSLFGVSNPNTRLPCKARRHQGLSVVIHLGHVHSLNTCPRHMIIGYHVCAVLSC